MFISIISKSLIMKKLLYSSSIFSIILLLISCNVDDSQHLEQRNWSLSWSDEFNGEKGTLPDDSKWNIDIGNGTDGWGNQEYQYYTDHPENLSMDGEGNLIITARNEHFGGQPFTSGRINTKGHFSQTYGRFEARIKTPYGPGIWPSFWLLGADLDDKPWPQCGEIDIMELRGQIPNVVNGSVHGPNYSSGSAISKSFGLENGRFDTDYHIYAIEWGIDYLEFYVDDTLYQKLTPQDLPGNWVFDHDFFIILNVAVGGNYVGFPTSKTPFPQQMVVDYVRVYN